MGFAGVSGPPMATRSGDVPIDVLFYLLRQKKFDDTSLEKMLYQRSGLLGVTCASWSNPGIRGRPRPSIISSMR
jgi:acetate kinase